MAITHESISDLPAWFGKTPGADRTLIAWDDMRSWFAEVEQASARLAIRNLGQSERGAEMDLLIVSSEATIRDLEHMLAQREALTRPELLADPANEAGTLAGTKPVVLITAGIHADEVGGVQLMPELISRLALSQDRSITELLDRVIVLIVPTLNPDGMNLVHEWYEKTLGTSAEGSDPPGLYHPYAGHDNNRDWYTHALSETRNTIDAVHRPWRPHIVLDLHQMGEDAPRYVVPPYIDPVEPHLHPLINVLSSEIGTGIATAQRRAGHNGASSGVMFDGYSPTRAYQHYHGGVRILAEAASASIATPTDIHPDQVKVRRGFDPNLPSVHNPVPWDGGIWRLRDIMDYHLTTIFAVLDHAAAQADQWMRDQWQMLADEVRTKNPITYVIAPLRQQIDPPATHALIDIMRRGDVRVEIAESGADSIPAGSLLIRSGQPFGSYARALLDLTPYPVPRPGERGTPPATPYDVTSHCLPLHMGVEVRRLDHDPTIDSRPFADSDLVVFDPPSASDIDRSRWLAIDPRSHRAISVVIHALQNGAEVRRLLQPHLEAGRILAAGTWLVADDHVFATMSDAHQHGIRTWLVNPIPFGAPVQTLPRIGLHMPWMGDAIDAGWTQLALEQLGISLDLLHDNDIRAGNLERYDAILIPHLKGKNLLNGNSTSTYPEQFCGGLDDEAVAHLRQYLEAGGHLIAIDGAAAALIPRLDVPVNLPLQSLEDGAFSCPGSILRVIPDPSHPVTLGMDESCPVMFTSSTTFAAGSEGMPQSPATFATNALLLSGWIQGEEHLHGTSAIIEAAIGRGIFTAFGFRPVFRTQMLATFPMLTNALMRPGLRVHGDSD